MKYAIIAAGNGSRLAEEGIESPKALVKMQGMPVIERLVNIFIDNNASEIDIIINAHNPETELFLNRLIERETRVPIRLVVQTTPSSMHSFFALSSYLREEPFCLTTVDTIFKPEEFKRFIIAFQQADEIDGLMGVTDFIDDEKPLYINVDRDMKITAFLDKPDNTTRYISGGIYALKPQCLATLERCMREGQSRMRNFQRGLIVDGHTLKAYPFSKILDVDHASDIEKAEQFLSE